MEELNTRYGYIYKITNLINGKIYIGKRVGSVLDERYWGSGTKIKKAIKEFGLHNFKREILEWCSTKDILRDRERYWIFQLNARHPDFGYNVKKGGEGSRDDLPLKVKKDNKIVGVQVPGFLVNALDSEAESLGLSTSAMIRLILAQRYRDDAKFNDVEDN